MKTIQTFTHYQFSEKTVKIVDQGLFFALTIFAFVFLCLPFMMLYFRL